MSSTNVPQIQWLPTGLSLPTAAAILAGVQADINAAFGGNLNFTNQQSPQSQLAASLTAIIVNANAALAYFVNNVNPNAASDFMQDAIGYIYFLTRIAGTPTTVQGLCTGLVGTVIPAGSQVQDTSGNLYESTAPATIGGGGTVTVTFESVVNGPIACPAGTMTTIYQPIAGWDSVTNSADGTPGTNVESQAAFAYRMKQSVAVNAQGSLPSLFSALAELVGAPNVLCIENDTSGTVNTGSTNYPMLPYSIYVAVAGGTQAAIAQAIFEKKSPGCQMNGNTSVTVYDPSYPTNQAPAYLIKYNVPTSTPIAFAVRIANSTSLPANITQLVQQAIIDQFQDGSSTVEPQGIGSLIVAANYFAPVIATFSGMALLSILVGVPFVGTGSVTSSNVLTISAVTSGFLAAGDIVSGTDIPTGTYIINQLTGTPGGAGTYTLSANASGTASGITVTSTAGNLQQYQCGIDQLPTITATNISVTLV